MRMTLVPTLYNVPQRRKMLFSTNDCGILKTIRMGVPIVAQWLTNPTNNHEVLGSIPGLAQWVKDLALLCAEV